MRFLYLAAGALILGGALYAQESCEQMLGALENKERTYERQRAAGNDASQAADAFIRSAESVLSRCRHTLSFEKSRRLQQRVDDAKSLQASTRPLRPSGALRDPRGRESYPQGVIKTH